MEKIKKYTIAVFIILSMHSHAQIDELMKNFDNKFALEHIEMFTKNYDKITGLVDSIEFNDSFKIVNVDDNWLQNITTIIKQNPAIIYPYLESSTQNLAAYILLVHTFDLKIPGSEELVDVNFLKRYAFEPEELTRYAINNSIPQGMDPAVHLINKCRLEQYCYRSKY